MKSVKTIFATIALSAVSLTSAVASTAPDGVDSGILVLAFAGFLALVVVLQTIPAAITLYSMIKGAAEASKQQVAAKATSRT
jgi:hypothetical protein